MMVQRLGIAALLLLGCSAEPWLGPAFLWTQSGGSAGALAGSKAQASYQVGPQRLVPYPRKALQQGAAQPAGCRRRPASTRWPGWPAT